MSMLLALVAFATPATAEEKTLEQRVSDLESSLPSIPGGVFVNGELEILYDPDTYTSDFDSRAEIQMGLASEIDNSVLNWAGASAKFDSHYSLDTTQNNKIVEKQFGIGVPFGRIYLGETDAQRLGFSKTPKISVPLIYTENNYRIDHNEKIALTFGGWDNNNEFDFDNYSLQRDLPIGGVIAHDAANDVTYYGLTANVVGWVDVSYMRISAPDTSTNDDTIEIVPFSKLIGGASKKDQEGWSIGGSLHRIDIPLVWGVELWDDKNSGTFTKDNRLDYGALYSLTDEVAVTYHRTENDDMGYDGNYYGAIYTVDAGKGSEIEMGVYYHDKEQTNVFTGANSSSDSILASLKYKF